MDGLVVLLPLVAGSCFYQYFQGYIPGNSHIHTARHLFSHRVRALLYTPCKTARVPVRSHWQHSCSMPTGGLYRTPLAKPSCKLSRAVLDSDKDGAKQVPPQGPQAQLHLTSGAWASVASGAHHTLRGAGLRNNAPTTLRTAPPPRLPYSPLSFHLHVSTMGLGWTPNRGSGLPKLGLGCLTSRRWLPRPQVIKLLRSAPVGGTRPNELRPLTYAVLLGRSRAVEALLKAPHPTPPCPVARAPQHTRCTTSTHPVGWVPLHMSHLAAQR